MVDFAKMLAEKRARIVTETAVRELKPSDVTVHGGKLISKKDAAKANAETNRRVKAALAADTAHSVLVQTAEEQFSAGVAATIKSMRDAQAGADIIYDDSQLAAIAGVLHNRVSVLIGAAGTGKTTVTRKIVDELAKRVGKINPDDAQFVTAVLPDGKYIRMLRSEALRNEFKIKDDNNRPSEEMPAIAFAAYTGRASQQLRKALPEEWQKSVSTIHSLLGYAPVFEEEEAIDPLTQQEYMKTVKRFRPSFNEDHKLPFMFVVLDEASMIPVQLFNELIAALPEGARILLIGDIHQLPPVYGKSVLGYAMREWPVFELTTIHRQAAGNAIIQNAHNTLRGRALENAKNFHLIGDNKSKNPSPGGQNDLQVYVRRVVQQLADLGRYDPYRDAIIVPQNKGLCGADSLNEHFVTMFNPEVTEHGIIVNKRIIIHTGTAHLTFAIRDKVMITKNIPNTEPPITNGMIGIVESINLNGKYDLKRSQIDTDDEDDDAPLEINFDTLNISLDSDTKNDEKVDREDETEDQRQSSHVMVIKFENGQTYECSTAGDYRRVLHGYAATCHKSQGGEYPSIIILCHSVNARMLSQEWLYTAITRARENVYIICNNRGLDQALKNQRIKGYTLKDKIKSYLIETKIDEDGVMDFDTSKFPILWKSEEVK